MFPDLKFKLHKTAGKLEKLGSAYGGWIIPTNHLSVNSICYMAGAGEDISFDLAVAKRFRCQVLIFDPTPRAKAHFDLIMEKAKSMNSFPINNNTHELYELDKDNAGHMKFHEIGLWNKTDNLKFFSPKNKAHISHSIANLQETDEYFMAKVERLSEVMRGNSHTYLDPSETRH